MIEYLREESTTNHHGLTKFVKGQGVAPQPQRQNFVASSRYTVQYVSTPQFKNYVATLFFSFPAKKAEFGSCI